jgi:hypothetical protein
MGEDVNRETLVQLEANFDHMERIDGGEYGMARPNSNRTEFGTSSLYKRYSTL